MGEQESDELTARMSASSGVRSLRGSEMAAIKGFPDAQTWIFSFPILTAASEQSPDGQINQ